METAIPDPTCGPFRETRGRPRGRQQEVTVPPAVAAELERQADTLLGQLLLDSAESGLYAQVALDRKMRDEQKRMPVLEESGVSEEMIECLVERQVSELIDAAGLSAIEEIVYRLYVSGLGGKRISEALGIRRRTIDTRLRSVKRKVRAAYEEGIYAGWYEVYLSEVNRPAYRRRR